MDIQVPFNMLVSYFLSLKLLMIDKHAEGDQNL